ncbi:MAG: hypothetical protein AB7P33_15930 [Dehalococcoidia bacterium]
MVDRIEHGDEVQFSHYTGIPVRFSHYDGAVVKATRFTGLVVKPTHFVGQQIIVTNPEDVPLWVRQKFRI